MITRRKSSLAPAPVPRSYALGEAVVAWLPEAWEDGVHWPAMQAAGRIAETQPDAVEYLRVLVSSVPYLLPAWRVRPAAGEVGKCGS